MRFETAAILAALMLCRAVARPHEPEAPAGFEVASVKPAVGGPLKVQSDPGRLTFTSESLDVLIELAYGLREYQYQGPIWLHTTRYDIVATTPSPQPRAAQMAMLQSLLADRFKLKIHREVKTMPVYWLVVAKNGAKLMPIDANLPAPFDLYYNLGMAPTPTGQTELHGVGSLALLCDFLTRVTERPVIDRTGIAGSFDLRLLCAIDGFPGYDTSPTVFDALPPQLGLKLEPHTGEVAVTVVDHADKPTVN